MTNSHSPLVTIIIATHNRPQTLSVAVQSACAQTLTDWQMIVVGDACDPATAAVLAAIDDPRITYINLPVWCGEQAIPNSLGMRLAQGRYIALLNHDDVWLPDHLELAVDQLNCGGDFFLAQSAVAYTVRERQGRVEPIFAALSNPSTRLSDILYNHGSKTYSLFEPVSSWVFRRELVTRVGVWQPAYKLVDKPIENWLKRAFRAGVTLKTGDRLTVLKLQTYWQARVSEKEQIGQYYVASPEHETLRQWLNSFDAQELRNHIQTMVAANTNTTLGSTTQNLTLKMWLRSLKPWFYYYFGVDIDLIRSRLRGETPGKYFNDLTIGRTGKPLPKTVDLNVLLQQVSNT